MPRIAGVYVIVNEITTDFYIGSSVGIENRLDDHFKKLRNGKHANSFLQSSFNKYGEEVFTTKIVEEVSNINEIRIREQFWIEELKPTYNALIVVDGKITVSEETRKRMSESAKIAANNRSPEVVEAQTQRFIKAGREAFIRYNKSFKGLPVSDARRSQLEEARQAYREKGVSEETKQKLSKASKGRILSEGHKNKISEARKGKPSPNKGKKFSDQAKENMSKAQKERNYIPSKEVREKMSKKTFSQEARNAISESSKKRWQRYRESKTNN